MKNKYQRELGSIPHFKEVAGRAAKSLARNIAMTDRAFTRSIERIREKQEEGIGEWQFDWDNPKESIRRIVREELLALVSKHCAIEIKQEKKGKK